MDSLSSTLFAGEGEMAALMRAKDWSATPLGPVADWPASLRMMVRFLLANRFPLLLWWGPEYVSIYNDAYRPILGNKHPVSLGQPVSECWSEIWHILQPLIDTPFNGGPATWMEDIPLEIARYDFVEETHFTIAYSPVPDETAPRGIGGVLATVHEITEKVVGERRVSVLRDLGARTGEARTAAETCALTADILANHPLDVPFALLYLIDEDAKEARLAGSVGVDASPFARAASGSLEADDESFPWPLAEVVRTQSPVVIEDLAARLPSVPAGPWSDPPRCAVVLPVRSNRPQHLAAILVMGVSSRLRLDDQYRSFLVLAADQVATAIATARAYEDERRRADALAEIDRAKTAFLSNASHEFRTPLTLMLGPLEDALARLASDEPGQIERHELELMHRNGVRLLKLVNALLDFSRIEAGRVQATYEPTDLGAYTAELAGYFRSAMERAGLAFVIDSAPLALPVYVDRDMWEKIVLNLLSNAFKFTLAGEIEVAVRAEGDDVVLRVSDTGTGIPEAELPLIFERFHRVEGARGRTHEGTGIGLALVQELVERHGGSVGVESTCGRGTTFTVRIPFGSAHLPQDRIGGSRRHMPTATRAEAFVSEALRWLPDAMRPDGITDGDELPEPPAAVEARAKVLLADDNADMRQYLTGLLAPYYEVTAVADGEEAIAAAKRSPPDLVLTDVMMPRLDGFEMLKHMRGDDELRHLPVIVLSARAGEEAQVDGLRMGADDYLVKPFSARELLARLRVNLEKARLYKTAQEEIGRRRQIEAALRENEEALEAKIDERVAQLVASNAQLLLEAEERVKTEGYFRLLVGSVIDYAIYMLDPTGIITNWNAGAERIKGYSAKEIIGEHFSRFYTAEDRRSGLPARALGIAAKEGKFEGEGWRVRRDGSRFWASVVINAIHDPDGGLLGFAKVTRDLTERRLAEERARQAQKMEVVGQLTGGIAHDFNNLLTVISGNIESLERGLPDDVGENLRRFARTALQGADRAAILTHRLLAFSRQQPLEPKPLSVNALVTGMSEMLRRTIGEGIRIEHVLTDGIWTTFVDGNQLENAILNLAINARDAMPSGGTVTIEAANVYLDPEAAQNAELPPGQYVGLFVTDTGTGMTPEIVAKAFEPFFTTKEVGQGTGLGLSQVYGFIKQSGGHVKIYSEVGGGTTVKLYLPRYIAADQPIHVRVDETSVPRADGETVLVVEDEPDVRTYVTEMLRELGYRVVEAPDGQRGLEILKTHRDIKLLFTDVGLPGGMNGRQLADEARRRSAGLKVLFTSGYARDVIVHNGRVDAGVELIRKPFTYAALASKVRHVLDSW